MPKTSTSIAPEYDEHDFNGNRDRIIDYAGRGFSGQYIAKATGLPKVLVYRILKSEYIERHNNRQAIIESQDQTIRWLKLKITNRIHKAEDSWSRQDAELLLKLMEREAKLHGLDAATQHQHQVNVVVEDLTDDEVIKQLRAEGLEIKQLAPAQPAPVEKPAEDAEFVEKIPDLSEDKHG